MGSLPPGKQADIVLLQANAINTAPLIDPIGTIVVFLDTSNVELRLRGAKNGVAGTSRSRSVSRAEWKSWDIALGLHRAEQGYGIRGN